MSKIDVVRAAMVEAMKAKDKERKDSLSMLLSALKNAQIDKREAPLTEDEENAIVKKEIKQVKETIDTAPADRADIIEEEETGCISGVRSGRYDRGPDQRDDPESSRRARNRSSDRKGQRKVHEVLNAACKGKGRRQDRK